MSDFHPIRSKTFPEHIGIIPDGGRRWAKLHNVSNIDSYRLSMRKIFSLTDRLYENKAKEVSVYFSSLQNFGRKNHEVYDFCKAEAEFLEQYTHLYRNKNIRVVVAGKISIVPDYLHEAIEKSKTMTSNNTDKRLNLCIAYDPLYEINKAIETTNNVFDFSKLTIKRPLNLIIRSGGANLISNFLPLQSGFARLYTSEKLFNDIDWDDIDKYIQKYLEIKQIYGE